MERWHFWFRGRRFLVKRLLRRHLDPGQKLLDVGCGSGFNLFWLTEFGSQVFGVDERPEGLVAMVQSLPSAGLAQSSGRALPFRSASFGGVFLLDVLEHTDDAVLLNEVSRIIRPGGILVLSAPALSWLWSRRDREAGHRRRYSRRSLTRLIQTGSWKISEMRYYQYWLFPLFVLTRLWGKRNPEACEMEETPPKWLNHLFYQINRREILWGDFIPWPWGSSLIAVCRKL